MSKPHGTEIVFQAKPFFHIFQVTFCAKLTGSACVPLGATTTKRLFLKSHCAQLSVLQQLLLNFFSLLYSCLHFQISALFREDVFLMQTVHFLLLLHIKSFPKASQHNLCLCCHPILSDEQTSFKYCREEQYKYSYHELVDGAAVAQEVV